MIYTGLDRWSPPDSYLEHYGVKGMKWGVRKSLRKIGSGYRKASNRYLSNRIAKRKAEKAKFNKEMNESPLANTKFGKAYRKVSNTFLNERISLAKKDKSKFNKEMDDFMKPINAIKSLKNYPSKSKAKRYNNSDYAKAKSMSNQELQARINRINLEQNYISAMQRDRSAYRDATDGVLRKWGRRTTSGLYNKFINSGSSAIDIGGQLTRNAITNKANQVAPVTRKPKK